MQHVVSNQAGGEPNDRLARKDGWLVQLHFSLQFFLLRATLACVRNGHEKLKAEIQIECSCANGRAEGIPLNLSDLER